MNELDYVECMVKRKTKPLFVFLKFLCIFLAVISAFGFMFLGMQILGTIVTLAFTVFFGFMAYLCNLNANIEYEYQYCDREVTVDKILNKNSRKRVGKFETERMEAFGPINSYHLDEYKNKNYQVLDFSDGEVHQPDTRYAFYYDGRQKLIMNPDEKLVAAVYQVAPRKTFKD
jgi:hypothetical protein